MSGDEFALWGGGEPCFTWRDADRTVLFGQESDEKRTEVTINDQGRAITRNL